MNERVSLYYFKDASIKIDIEAYFENGDLVVEGYDIGQKVKEYFGDSDYEYSVRVKAEDLSPVYRLMQVEQGNRAALLDALAERYNTNSCYSEIRKFLDDNSIRSSGFSWA